MEITCAAAGPSTRSLFENRPGSLLVQSDCRPVWTFVSCGRDHSVVPTYSLVVPAYNEEGVIDELVAHRVQVMDALDGDAEAILVDDGSRDRTYELMVKAVSTDPRFRLVR